MPFRLLPKVLLWVMLTVSCLGAIATLQRPEAGMPFSVQSQTEQQQMAVTTAVGFAREWMAWDGSEMPEARLQRLKTYVNPEMLARIADLQAESQTARQQVIAAELVSLVSSASPHFTVRVRVIALNPERVNWELEVPVWAQTGQGAAVTGPPLIRLPQTSPVVPAQENAETAISADMKQRLRPMIESFLKAMCEGKDAASLSNYVTAEAKLLPLAGRIRFASLDRVEGAGAGPYVVAATFIAQDAASGFRFAQVWRLTVIQENGKFFVSKTAV